MKNNNIILNKNVSKFKKQMYYLEKDSQYALNIRVLPDTFLAGYPVSSFITKYQVSGQFKYPVSGQILKIAGYPAKPDIWPNPTEYRNASSCIKYLSIYITQIVHFSFLLVELIMIFFHLYILTKGNFHFLSSNCSF